MHAMDEQPQSATAKISKRDLIAMLFRHQFLILGCLALGAIVALTLIANSTRLYRSEATLLIRFVRDSVRLEPRTETDEIISAHSWENTINSELEILRSHELAKTVVRQLQTQFTLADSDDSDTVVNVFGLPKYLQQLLSRQLDRLQASITGISSRDRLQQLSFEQRLLLTFMDQLEIEVPLRSNIITLAYTADDPLWAQQALQGLIDAYLAKHQQVHRATRTYDFYASQAETLKHSLYQRRQQYRQLKDQLEIGSYDNGQEIVTAHIGDLRQQIRQTQALLAASNARQQWFDNRVRQQQQRLAAEVADEAIEIPFMQAAVIRRMRERLVELTVERQELLAAYTVESVPIRRLDQQINRLQASLAQYPGFENIDFDRRDNNNFADFGLAVIPEEVQVLTLQAQLAVLQEQLEDARRTFQTLNKSEMQLRQLENEIEVTQLNYQRYAQLAEQAQIAQVEEADRIANISVVETATLPILPEPSLAGEKIGISMLVALLVGLGFAFVLDQFLDHSLKTPEDVETKLDLLALATIPHLRWYRKTPRLRKLSVQEQDPDAPTQAWHLPVKMRDYFEQLCDRLPVLLNEPLDRPVIYAVASCRGGEGTSTVASNLAVAMAERGRRVLVVDANNERPAERHIFGRRFSRHATDVDIQGLGRTKELQKNLYLLPGYELARGTADTYTPQRLRETLLPIFSKNNYNTVIMDLPPLCEASAAMRLAAVADAVVVVIEAERGRWEVIQRQQQFLKRANIRILGAVLNKRKLHIPGWLYDKL